MICMNNIESYLSDTFGIETTIISLERRLLSQLPLYIKSIYKVRETKIYGRRISLFIANDENAMTPGQLYKQMVVAEQKLGLPVVFVFYKPIPYKIQRLIKMGVNFIIPYRQLFIPSLMMNLRKITATIPTKTNLLTPVAQLTLLFHLQKEELNGFTTKQLFSKFNESYLTVSRAVKNLEELGLCTFVGKRNKQIQFNAKGKKLWLKSQNFLQNPVERVVFADELLKNNKAFVSNINTLSYYSMLNDETKRHYAIDKKNANKLTIKTNKYDGDNTIEIWRYNPEILSNNGFLDKLSLFLSLKNDTDDRIQNELEQMISGIKWLEE